MTMEPITAVATVRQRPTLSQEEVQTIRDQFDPDLTDSDLSLFLHSCKATGLDPLTRQIYAIARFDKRLGRKKMSIQTSIDGFRLIADRSGVYAGQVGPFWCGDDGVWRETWPKSLGNPVAAKVGALRHGFAQPLFAVAHWEEYVPEEKSAAMWRSKPALMLAKCAEALALRKAFPAEMSGVYTDDEMDRAELIETTAVESESVTPARIPDPEMAPEVAERWERVKGLRDELGLSNTDLGDRLESITDGALRDPRQAAPGPLDVLIAELEELKLDAQADQAVEAELVPGPISRTYLEGEAPAEDETPEAAQAVIERIQSKIPGAEVVK